MSRVILHSDCNSFYASVECLHRPQIKDKPVAVSGNAQDRHGIILARNEVAKKCGVRTAETIWQARQKCPELITVEPNFQLYTRFSKMAKNIYLDYTDKVESFGLDEAWLDVTDCSVIYGSGMNIAEQIRSRIKNELGITVSIGVSFNKIFAKIGSDYKKPDAVTEFSEKNFKERIWPMPCSNLLYVGHSTEKKLRMMGIYTIGDLAKAPLETLIKNLGKQGEMLHCFANGNDSSPVSVCGSESDVKSISNSTTCPRDLSNREDVKIVMQVLADSVGRRLRESGLYCKCISISIRNNKLTSFTRQQALTRSTNLTDDILKTALALFDTYCDFKIPIRSIGITLSKLCNTYDDEQLSVFDNSLKRERMEKLDKTLDSLKSRFGTSSVFPASSMLDSELSGFDPKTEHVIFPGCDVVEYKKSSHITSL